MKTYFILFGGVVLFNFCVSAAGQGTIIVQHTGSVNPLNEGFSGGGGGPITNDMGMGAWFTKGPANYIATFSPQQTGQLAGASWVLSLTLRVAGADTNSEQGAVWLYTGSQYSILRFGCEANGDQYVTAGTNTYIVAGGSTYNNYQVVYNAASGTGDLWVNGIEVINNVVGITSGGGSIQWGGDEGSSWVGQINWNNVSLEIVPEPSVFSLVCLGGGILIYVRRRRGRSTRILA